MLDLTKPLRKPDFVNIHSPRSIDDYLRLVRNLELPSVSQITAFVKYVSDAHSWYKHWSPDPEKCKYLLVYPDPNAGYAFRKDDATTSEEVWLPRELKKGDRDMFHYSSLETQEYRQRFGALTYDALTTRENLADLIPELIDFAAPVTALLHPHYADYYEDGDYRNELKEKSKRVPREVSRETFLKIMRHTIRGAFVEEAPPLEYSYERIVRKVARKKEQLIEKRFDMLIAVTLKAIELRDYISKRRQPV